jgi:hypothetical protein
MALVEPPAPPAAWWCWTHLNATTNPDGCGVAGHCRLIGPYPSLLAAAAWEDDQDGTGRG